MEVLRITLLHVRIKAWRSYVRKLNVEKKIQTTSIQIDSIE